MNPLPALHQGTVLVVDDTEASLYAKSRLLRAEGFNIVTAATGIEALRLAREHKPDLVLLDVQLPDIDGFEVCRRLRAAPETASLAIVHISASYELPEHQVRGLDIGADTYLLAPIDPGVLTATVRAMIRLRKAENALRESDRRKDEFLAVLAHELRNPLAPLRYGLQLFQRAQLVDPQLHTAREIMERQISQMVRLIDDLLEISRINQNKLELRNEETTIAQVLENAIETCRPSIDAAGHRLDVQMPVEPLALNGDRVRLSQVFGNLLSNSTRYMPPGGRIDIQVLREGDEAVVAVRDHGIGISTEELPRVFDMFAQAHRNNVGQRSEGLGIGLALVKRLVEMHGGTVSAESAGPGEGSTFTVRLPLAAPHTALADAAPAAASALNGNARKVLIADDNVDSAESLAMVLSCSGHEVRVAHDGLEALNIAQEFHPNLIVLDVSMPRLTGLEAAQRIRAQSWARDTVICALTGYGQERDRRRSEEVGIDHHMVKPIHPEELLKLLV